jgi:ABC-2 type transport system ATP-binding protein
VEFDFQVEEQLISKIENLVSYVTFTIWCGNWLKDKDMRSIVFDFAQNNGLKTLQLNQKNKT